MLACIRLLSTFGGRSNNVTSNLSKMAKRLGVFDFDHTVVDDNTDIVVRKLLKVNQVPDEVRNLYRSSGWTVYMQEVFKLLKKHNIKEDEVRKAINKIPPVESMSKLITNMVDNLNYDVIIISDSNSLFIESWLESNGLRKYVHTVFTNPAKYDTKGLLRIDMYHVQNECKLSTVNLCKGMIMESFLAAQEKLGVNYDKVVYVGDGKNDFCPMLRLKPTDLACVRAKYTCEELVKKSIQEDNPDKLKAKVLVWSNGQEILDAIC